MVDEFATEYVSAAIVVFCGMKRTEIRKNAATESMQST